MKKNTKSLLVAGGLAAGAAVVIGTILLWPKKASAANPPLPLELDANLTAQQKADVGALLNSSNNPEALAQAAWNYMQAFNATIAGDLLAKKALGIVLPQLDADYPKSDINVLFPLYISTNPVELDGLAMKAASDGYPKLATLIRNRARILSGL